MYNLKLQKENGAESIRILRSAAFVDRPREKKYKTLNLKLLSQTSLNVKLLLLERHHKK